MNESDSFPASDRIDMEGMPVTPFLEGGLRPEPGCSSSSDRLRSSKSCLQHCGSDYCPELKRLTDSPIPVTTSNQA